MGGGTLGADDSPAQGRPYVAIRASASGPDGDSVLGDTLQEVAVTDLDAIENIVVDEFEIATPDGRAGSELRSQNFRPLYRELSPGGGLPGGPQDLTPMDPRDSRRVMCAAMRPRWVARGSFVYMDRVTEDAKTIAVNTGNETEQLNANGFDFQWRPGLDVSLFRKEWDDSGWELRYFGVERYRSRQGISVSNGLVSINTLPPVFVPDVLSIDSQLRSSLWSFEFNYRYAMYEWLSVWGGFRYLSFDDDLGTVIGSAGATQVYNVSARNDLYGGQIGAATVPPCAQLGCLWFSGWGNLGIYGNDAEQRSVLASDITGTVANASADNSSIVFELGLTVDCPLGRHVNVYGGYRMLLLERIAVAVDQVTATDFFNGTGSDDDGGVLFHGANLGIEIRL